MIAQAIAKHPDVGAITGAPVPENEGVYLQGAIPHLATSGRPGRFADEPDMHLVEGGPYDRLDVRRRLDADWSRWFPEGVRWRVEKSPVNLLRARLYQQLFPTAQFLFVVRHPVAVAQATLKWTDQDVPDLIRHWATAHGLLAGDLPLLHCYLIVRYEDFCNNPGVELSRVWTFLDVPPHSVQVRLEDPTRYLEEPCGDLPEVAWAFGYRCDAPWAGPMTIQPGQHYFRRIVERLQGPAMGPA